MSKNEYYKTLEEARIALLNWRGYSKKIDWSVRKGKWRVWIGRKYKV